MWKQKPNFMTIKTPKGAIFDTEKSAKSNLVTTLDANGRQVIDTLEITGKMSICEKFGEQFAMIEVKHSFGITEVSEDYLWQ